MNREYILITGATGFIGSHVADKLLSKGAYNLVAIVRRNSKYKNVDELKQRGVILVEGNFYDKNLVEKIFEKFPVQHVIHIAAVRGSGAGTEEEYHRVNVYGTEVLLEASLSHQVKKFIFCSSVGVFGTIPSELPANMNTKLNGDNAYHRSKIIAEQKVRKFINKGLNAFVVRPTITYGKQDDGFSATLVKLVRRRQLLLPNNRNKIHLLDVNRLAEVFRKLLIVDDLKNRFFIIADDQPIILKELVDLVYYYFNQKQYPQILSVPGFFFSALLLIFQAAKKSKWCVRFQLISRNWYYDITEMNSLSNCRPSRTKIEFLKYLETLH